MPGIGHALGMAEQTLANILQQVKAAREQAVAGEYSSAVVYYDGVLSQLSRQVPACDGRQVCGQYVTV